MLFFNEKYPWGSWAVVGFSLAWLVVSGVSTTAWAKGGDKSTAGSGALARRLASVPGLVDAGALVPRLLVKLRYAGKDNPLGEDLYDGMKRCFLRKQTAAKLARADVLLRKKHPGLRLLAYDCTRPVSVQWKLWRAARKLLPKKQLRNYVAYPGGKVGSMHNYGCAIDLTVAHASGKPLDMGTTYDHLGPEAQVRKERAMLKAGKLTSAQLVNRRILRRAMVGAGFLILPTEWWHFNGASRAHVLRHYRKVP